jgi:hypothetical protein
VHLFSTGMPHFQVSQEQLDNARKASHMDTGDQSGKLKSQGTLGTLGTRFTFKNTFHEVRGVRGVEPTHTFGLYTTIPYVLQHPATNQWKR